MHSSEAFDCGRRKARERKKALPSAFLGKAVDDYPSAFSGKGLGDGSPNPSARSRHESQLVFEVEIHFATIS